MNDIDGIGDDARRMIARSPSVQAALIARAIFEAPRGFGPFDVKRIQFRGEHEEDLGGLCEAALVALIYRVLRGQ